MNAISVPRRGMAVMMALVSLLLIAGGVSALMHATLGEQRRGAFAFRRLQVEGAADAGAYTVARDWSPGARDTLPIGSTLVTRHHLAGADVDVTSHRLAPWLWLTHSQAVAIDGGGITRAARGVTVLWRLMRPDPPTSAALTASDSVRMAAGSLIVGTDSSSLAIGSCPTPANVAGVALPDTTVLCVSGLCGRGGVGSVLGAPPLQLNPVAQDSNTYQQPGQFSWAQLVALADIQLATGSVLSPAPVVVGAACDRLSPSNWGDPIGGGVCADYAPTIHVAGDVEMVGGVGQGILLVDGDFIMSNGARFFGLVIARDDIVMRNSGGTIEGSALAGDRRRGPADHTDLGTNGRVQYASCTLDRALRLSGRLWPVPGRSWAVAR